MNPEGPTIWHCNGIGCKKTAEKLEISLAAPTEGLVTINEGAREGILIIDGVTFRYQVSTCMWQCEKAPNFLVTDPNGTRIELTGIKTREQLEVALRAYIADKRQSDPQGN